MDRPQLLFVTGKLAEPALRHTLDSLAAQAGFEDSVAVLPSSVVALATTDWIARHVDIPTPVSRVILPGLCRGDLAPLTERTAATVERGPKDLLDLPEFFQATKSKAADYGAY